jgi:hypothetical protein
MSIGSVSITLNTSVVLAGTPAAAAMIGEPMRGTNSSKAICVSWMSIQGSRRVGSSCGCRPPADAANLATPRIVVPSAAPAAS